ncbi:MAG: hypothetical protein AAF496_11220 [Pseudomonadota bacterium]
MGISNNSEHDLKDLQTKRTATLEAQESSLSINDDLLNQAKNSFMARYGHVDFSSPAYATRVVPFGAAKLITVEALENQVDRVISYVVVQEGRSPQAFDYADEALNRLASDNLIFGMSISYIRVLSLSVIALILALVAGFVAVFSSSNESLAAIVGLLGVLAGYIAGKETA